MAFYNKLNNDNIKNNSTGAKIIATQKSNGKKVQSSGCNCGKKISNKKK